MHCDTAAKNQSVSFISLRQTYVLEAAETKFDQLSAEKEKLDNEVKRLNRAVSMLLTGPFHLYLILYSEYQVLLCVTLM